MAAKKYNYEQIKQDFFNSDYMDASSFIKDTFWVKTLSWQRLRNTKWWAKEKSAHLKKITDEAIEKSIEEQAEKLSKEIDMSRLIKNKHQVFENITKDLNEMYSNKKVIKAADLERYLKIIQTELHDQEKAKRSAEIDEKIRNWEFDFGF